MWCFIFWTFFHFNFRGKRVVLMFWPASCHRQGCGDRPTLGDWELVRWRNCWLAISFLLKIIFNSSLTLLDSQRITKNCILFTKKSRVALYYQHTFGISFAAAKSTIPVQAHQMVIEITGLSQFSTLLNVWKRNTTTGTNKKKISISGLVSNVWFRTLSSIRITP